MEFLDLIILTHESLYHAGCIYILLYGIVQHIVLVKYPDEMRVGCFCNKNQSSTQKWYGNKEKDRCRFTDSQCHDPGQNDHKRCPGQQSDTHHICLLHIGNVSGHSCNQS